MHPGEDATDFDSIQWPAHLGRIVTPVFIEVGPGSLAFCGSAILLAGPKDTHWLVSAAHVLAELENSQLAVSADGDAYYYIAVKSRLVSTCELTMGNASRDRKDLAFVQLHSATVREISRTFYFLPISAVDHSRQTPLPTPCILDGYPGELATIDMGRPIHLIELRSKSLLLPDAETKRRPGVISSVHLVAPFDRMRDESGQTRAVPNPAGMSGGAIWTQPGCELLLAAVMIEYDAGRGEIVATRVGPLVEEIVRRIANGETEN